MKKLIFVSDAIWPYNKGGKEKRLFDITTHLSKSFDVHIYTMKWWKGSDTVKENGITLHSICKLYPLYSGKRRSITEGIAFGLSCLRLLKEDWDAIDVDHIPFFPLFTIKLVCLLKRKKMTATWHEVWGRQYWIKYMGILGNLANFIQKLGVLMPDKIISVSEHTTKKLKKNLASKKDIVTILYGIDVPHIQKIKPADTKTDVIFTGRLLSHKNVDMLIKAIAILKKHMPQIRCLIIGQGPERENLKKLTNKLELGKNVDFSEFIENHDKVLSLIKSARVFVLPSSREGFGIVAVESFACDTPVVTADYSDNATKDLIKKGVNGFISKPNERSLAENIYKTLNIRGRMKPKQGVEKYDWKIIMQKINLSLNLG